MTPHRYPCAEVIYLTSRELIVYLPTKYVPRSYLSDNDVERIIIQAGDYPQAATCWNDRRVSGTFAGVDELPQVVPMAILLDGKDIRKN